MCVAVAQQEHTISRNQGLRNCGHLKRVGCSSRLIFSRDRSSGRGHLSDQKDSLVMLWRLTAVTPPSIVCLSRSTIKNIRQPHMSILDRCFRRAGFGYIETITAFIRSDVSNTGLDAWWCEMRSKTRLGKLGRRNSGPSFGWRMLTNVWRVPGWNKGTAA